MDLVCNNLEDLIPNNNNQIKLLFSNLYINKHVIDDEIYILGKRKEKKLNNL